jgi:hypothetical protein
MTRQRILGSPQQILLLAALFVFVSHRVPLESSRWLFSWLTSPSVPTIVVPSVDVSGLTPAYADLYTRLRRVSKDDLQTMATFYAGVARSLKADPQAEPVLTSTGQLRRAHRAGLLFVWAGIQNNDPAKYEGLGPSIEGVLLEAIGATDVPLNPSIRLSAMECFNKVAALCLNAQR